MKTLPADLERVRLNLKNSLLSSDVSLDQFCKQAGVAKVCVKNFCDGISKPQARMLERILKEMRGLHWTDLAQTEMKIEEVVPEIEPEKLGWYGGQIEIRKEPTFTKKEERYLTYAIIHGRETDDFKNALLDKLLSL